MPSICWTCTSANFLPKQKAGSVLLTTSFYNTSQSRSTTVRMFVPLLAGTSSAYLFLQCTKKLDVHRRLTTACEPLERLSCLVKMFWKLIRDITGPRSDALHLCECPTLQQKQAVSQALVQGKHAFAEVEKENCGPIPVCSASGASTQHCSSIWFQSLFTGLSICNVIVNVGTLPIVPAPVPRIKEAFLNGINSDEFLTSEMVVSYTDCTVNFSVSFNKLLNIYYDLLHCWIWSASQLACIVSISEVTNLHPGVNS